MQKGFTLIEYMIVLSLTAILGIAGVSQFSSMNAAAANSMAQQLFYTDIMRAKLEASSHGCRVIVSQAVDGKSYSLGLDCTPYSNSATPDSTLAKRLMPANMTITIGTPIIFDSRGFQIDTNGNLTTGTALMSRSGSAIRVFSIDSLGGVS